MNDLTPEVLAVFARHHGMATHTQLSNAGMGRTARARAVERGIFETRHERVLHLVSSPLTLEARCAAMCLAYPHGAIAAPTAAPLRGVRRVRHDGKVHFLVPHGHHIDPKHDTVVLHQTTKLPLNHVVKRGDEITLVADSRMAFDLAAVLAPLDHRSAVAALRKKGVTLGQLRRIGKELVHPARPGSARFMDTLLSLAPRPADSHPEVEVYEALRARGVPVEPQIDPHLTIKGVRIHLDLAVPAVRWGVEVDVHPSHLLLDGTTRDKRRDRACQRIDWQVARVSELDLVDLDATCDELAELYQARCQALASRAA